MPKPSSLAREGIAVPTGSSGNVNPGVTSAPPANPAAEGDFTEINRVLCRAFGGTTFTPHWNAKLKEYVRTGRITRLWAKGFARVKSAFDQDRDGFKAKKRFIPVQPSYLFTGFDLTEAAMLDTLGDWRENLDEYLRGFDEEDHAQAKAIIDEYDTYFRRNKCLEPGYETWVTGFPGRQDEVAIGLCMPTQFPYWDREKAVPPAWMRLLYASRINIYSFPAIRVVLLAAAQEELRSDPRCLKFVGVDLSDEQIRSLFDLDYEAELATWQKDFDLHDEQLAALEEILAEIQNCQAIAIAS